jgi:protein-tyrosine-phosphatase
LWNDQDGIFVCGGNLYRWLTAEKFLHQRLSEAGPPGVTVESAGAAGTGTRKRVTAPA